MIPLPQTMKAIVGPTVPLQDPPPRRIPPTPSRPSPTMHYTASLFYKECPL